MISPELQAELAECFQLLTDSRRKITGDREKVDVNAANRDGKVAQHLHGYSSAVENAKRHLGVPAISDEEGEQMQCLSTSVRSPLKHCHGSRTDSSQTEQSNADLELARTKFQTRAQILGDFANMIKTPHPSNDRFQETVASEAKLLAYIRARRSGMALQLNKRTFDHTAAVARRGKLQHRFTEKVNALKRETLRAENNEKLLVAARHENETLVSELEEVRGELHASRTDHKRLCEFVVFQRHLLKKQHAETYQWKTAADARSEVIADLRKQLEAANDSLDQQLKMNEQRYTDEKLKTGSIATLNKEVEMVTSTLQQLRTLTQQAKDDANEARISLEDERHEWCYQRAKCSV